MQHTDLTLESLNDNTVERFRNHLDLLQADVTYHGCPLGKTGALQCEESLLAIDSSGRLESSRLIRIILYVQLPERWLLSWLERQKGQSLPDAAGDLEFRAPFTIFGAKIANAELLPTMRLTGSGNGKLLRMEFEVIRECGTPLMEPFPL